MAGLQRSAISFRRQGSSGLVWDDKLLSSESNEQPITQREDNGNDSNKLQQEIIQGQEVKEEVTRVSSRNVGSIERSPSNGGGRGYRTGRVSPAMEPPSPKVSACGFCSCSAFGKPQEKTRRRRRPPPKPAGKRTM